jgi:peroxiredoxin
MVATKSSMLPLGTTAPAFKLKDVVSGEMVSLQKKDNAKGYLIAFICNHCPFVIHLLEHLPSRFNNIQDEGIKVFAISSNDIVDYPQDSPEKMKELSQSHGFRFPYLFDEKQDVATAFTAACTPDFFLFDKNLKLIYRGRYDATRPGSETQITGEDLLGAVDCLLGEGLPSNDQFPSIGCNIKWQAGKEPSYFSNKS